MEKIENAGGIMMRHGYQDPKLKEYVGRRIPVTAIYESCVLDSKSDNDKEYVLLADIRSVGGDLLRDHLWSPETAVFKKDGHLDRGTIIQFDGKVDKYSKGIALDEIDYTLINISEISVIGNRLISKEKCESCDYKRRTKELETKIDDYDKKIVRYSKDYRDNTERELDTKRKIKDLKEEKIELEEKNDDSKKIITSLKIRNKHLINKNNQLKDLMEDLYKISQRKTVTNVDRLKQRMKKMIGDAINCSTCNRKLNKCRCNS